MYSCACRAQVNVKFAEGTGRDERVYKMDCIKQNEIIGSILSSHSKDLGKYFEQYRNHVYRVYNFAVPYVTLERDIEILSIAAAFHDLGIWTSDTFDYLKPSIALAKEYSMANGLDAETTVEIETIIDLHHKVTPIEDSKIAEIFRQADLVDLTLGLIRNGRDRRDIRMVKEAFPNKGFHVYLLILFFKNFMNNPLRPLPMYKL